MGRKRVKNKKLPPRFHVKGSACYHVANPSYDTEKGKAVRRWTPIGSTNDLKSALVQWGIIENRDKEFPDNTIGGLAHRYRDLLLDLQNPLSLKARTRKEFLRMLRAAPPSTLLIAFGHMPLSDLKQHHIGSYLDGHPHKVAANREIALFSRMYRFAIRKGLCENNPCIAVEKNKELARDRYPEDWEYLAIRNYCSDYTNGNGYRPWQALAIAMDLSYLTSFRLGDVIQIEFPKEGESELRVRENKTDWKARVEVTRELQAVLERAKKLHRRHDCRTVVTNREGVEYTDTGFKSAWQRMIRTAKEEGIIAERFTFHDIRAKHATDKDEQGLSAQLALGHATPGQTAAYIRSRKGRKIDPLKTKIVEATPDFVEDGERDDS